MTERKRYYCGCHQPMERGGYNDATLKPREVRTTSGGEMLIQVAPGVWKTKQESKAHMATKLEIWRASLKTSPKVREYLRESEEAFYAKATEISNARRAKGL